MIRWIVALCLLAMIAALASGLFYFLRDKGESKRMITALTLRISISVALILFLLFAAWQGWLAPHGRPF
jgi:hypothetical protein